ncbi:sorting nexin-11 [Xyrichtys novacula]|uniref:Sorting nexin-11 n=1 Tax=Xyrichtys novacula TaxID=13765 RepID=A0AAV1H3E6_XYRNO|nr:sorting nexin-11 [Xyrichtys novacula]
MMRNQEEDEFVAVRVQDPRIQNEGSWNSYVDYKIFLHTNSKAFTAKTSCVRRRYSEFAWLRKKLQKNAGLVPVPELPGKSFFSFSNEDFLEGRRKGLQVFLDKVVHMTVCLSDSQLHLFLQTQLPVGHIQDCVQGHTPYSVTDAILTYASSNRGLAQAQEDDSIKEPSLTVSYESMESPAPHQPLTQTKDTFSPELLSCSEPNPLEGLLEDRVELRPKNKPSITVLQKDNHLEALVEDCGPGEASFFVGDSPHERLSLSESRSCLIQTPVEVHSTMGTGFEEESVETLHTEENTVTEEKEDQSEGDTEEVSLVNPEGVLGLKDEDVEVVLENHVTPEDNLELSGGTEGPVTNVSCPEVLERSDKEKSGQTEIQEETPLEPETHEDAPGEQTEQDFHKCDKSESEEETPQGGEIQEGTPDECQQTDQEQDEQRGDLIGTRDESDEESRSLPSSNGSIIKVSDEESVCDEAEEANGYMKTLPENWSEVEPSSGRILDLHINGCPVEKEDITATDVSDFSKSVDLHSAVTGGDLTENSDFSVIETSCSPVLAESKCAEEEEEEEEEEAALDVSEEAQEVEVHQLDMAETTETTS